MSEAAEAPFTSIGELTGILRRRRGLILITAILGTALAGGIGFLIPPRYTAKAQIVVEPQLSSLIGGQAAVIGQAPDEATLMTQLTAIKSHDLLGHVLDSLANDPSFRVAVSHARGPAAAIREQLWARLADWLPRRVLTLFSGPTWLSLPLLERHLDVFQEIGSHVIAVAYTSSSPQEAAVIANRIVQVYLDESTAQQRASLDKALAWFDRRIPELTQQVHRLDTQLQRMQVANGIGDSSRTNVVDQRLSDMNRQLSTAEAELAARKARYYGALAAQKRGQGMIDYVDSPTISDLRRNEATLLQTYASMAVTFSGSNAHMEQVRSQLQATRQEIARAVQAAIAGLASDVQMAEAQVNTLRTQVAAFEQATTDANLHALERGATSSRQLLARLEQRREELREQREGLPPAVQLLSMAAVPEHPSSLNPILYIPPAAVLFGMFGGFVAVLLDRLDTSLRSARDVAAQIGLPCIGLVPLLKGQRRPHQYLVERPFAPYSEAIRSVVAGLGLTSPQTTSNVILVTSSLPGEGKTTLAVSVAVYVAQLRRRVLLIDMDFRDPSVLRELGGVAEAGMADLFLHNRPASEYIRQFPEYHLDCLPLRRGLGVDPVKLFATEQLPRLLEHLRARYDCIVIDSAPLMAVTETRLLAPLADTVLLALRWASTHREAARNAVALLADPLLHRRKPPPRVVAALTQVDMKRHARYHYGDSGEFLAAYASYSRYASTVSETRAVAAPPAPVPSGEPQSGEHVQ